jgi:hypothetical protein
MANDRPCYAEAPSFEIRDWPMLNGNPMVFIHEWKFADMEANAPFLSKTSALLFGGRIPVEGGYTHRGERVTGHKLEFRVLFHEPQKGTTTEQHLLQDKSTLFTQAGEPDHDQHVDMMQRHKKPMPCLVRSPRWKVGGGNGKWGHLEERPMIFIGQIYLRENDLMRKVLTYGCSLFLFAGEDKTKTIHFKLYFQETSAQSAEDHYALEAMMSAFDRAPADREVILKCIDMGTEQGVGKQVHEYILNHARVSAVALELLAEQGANKQIRTKAQQMLRDVR